MQLRKQWNIFNVLVEKNYQPTIQYTIKISHKNKSKMKTFSKLQKLKELIAPDLHYKKC